MPMSSQHRNRGGAIGMVILVGELGLDGCYLGFILHA
jgi:hypothetical protein